MKKGQSVVSTIFLFLFMVVGIIVVSLLAPATTPLLNSFVTLNNITGGVALLVTHFNLVLVMILMIIGLLLVVAGGQQWIKNC